VRQRDEGPIRGPAVRAGPDLQLTRAGEGAQPGGQIDRAAPDAVPGRRPGRGHEHLAVLDADVHRRAYLGRAAGRDQGETGPHRAFGLVAVGVVQTEHTHEAVAQHLLDLAAVPQGDRDEILHERADHLIDDFRLDRLHQLGEAGEIGEQHGGEPPVFLRSARVVLQSDVHEQSETRRLPVDTSGASAFRLPRTR
jgi:hypothetical protein